MDEYPLFMKFLMHLILFISLSFVSIGGAFAESGKENTSNTKLESPDTGTGVKDTTLETPEEAEAKKQKIKDEISSYIIESYKAQWDKIIKDIEQTLQKTVPEKEDRIVAYQKIQSSLEARKKRNKASESSSEMSKEIIDAFLTHMIDSLGKKIREVWQ